MKIPIPKQFINKKGLPETNEAYIRNPYHAKEVLTPEEAMDCINQLSNRLLIDQRYRRSGG
jgi:hypothetical protein